MLLMTSPGFTRTEKKNFKELWELKETQNKSIYETSTRLNIRTHRQVRNGPEPACLQGSHFLVCWKFSNEILQSCRLINKFISPVFRGEHYKTKAQAGSVSGPGLFSG